MDPGRLPPTDDTLADLAAGDLPSEEAADLRARALTDAALAARIAAAEALEARLRSDGLLPVPVALVGRTLERVGREAAPWAVPVATPGRRAARIAAAAVLAAACAWTALGGLAPVAAVAGALAEPPLPPTLGVSLDGWSVPAVPTIPWPGLPEEPSTATTLASVPVSPVLSAVVAAVAVVAAFALARRRPKTT